VEGAFDAPAIWFLTPPKRTMEEDTVYVCPLYVIDD
jgi:hypothetical protein